jgi:hypothetical protein
MTLSTIPNHMQAALTSAQMPAGSVIQTLSDVYGTEASFNSSSFVGTGLTKPITPQFATSKILISFTMPLYVANEQTYGIATVYRETGLAGVGSAISGTNLGHGSWGFGHLHIDTSDGSASYWTGNVTANVLDSPNTTSEVRYSVAVRNNQSSTNYMYVHNCVGTLVLQEIAQ